MQIMLSQRMSFSIFWVLFLLVLSMGLPPLMGQQGEDADEGPIVLDEIVAKVNDEIITLTDLQKSLDQLRASMRDDYDTEEEWRKAFEQEKKLLLTSMIQNKIMVQKAEELGISPDIDMDVSAYLEQMRQEAGVPSLEVMDQYFKQRGSSLAEYRTRIREQMITQALMQQFVYSKITLLTPEVEAYYEEHEEDFTVPGSVELAEILFLTEEKDAAEARRLAEEALQRLEAGEEFAQVARDMSEGPTASRGGAIGSFNRGTMNDALEKVAYELPVGSHSGIIETEYGYQIVQILDRKEPAVKPLNEVRPQIADTLYRQKARPETREFFESLLDESYVYIDPDYAEEYDVSTLRQ